MNTPQDRKVEILCLTNVCIIGGYTSDTYLSSVEVWSEEGKKYIINKPLVLKMPRSLFGIIKTIKSQLLAITGCKKYRAASSLQQKIDNNTTKYSLERAKM